ncbi:MAG: leucyl/phenylalanyl-tRNA--protein transferase [Ilumatobacteraceae bacterium]|nr:leucyl/phenylalanyl-tRNA--protein transferase [Ilumatobacteraceae bacterium]
MTSAHRPRMQPPPSRWQLPSPAEADGHGLVGVGADLEPGTLLAAYAGGLFPMPMRKKLIGWWSPDPRGVLPLDGLIVSRSLRQSCHRFEVRIDTSFTEVVRRCGDPKRPHGWINEQFIEAYTLLHEMGWAHSIETWRDGELVGGLYGLLIGSFFAGESMFHSVTDASKVAVVATVEWLRQTGVELFDVQWSTSHLASLGVVEIPRAEYLRRLARATPS